MLLELIMIVKNSGEILRHCLRKNKKYIDRWTILDTGSTDNTPDIIREELKDVPGQLHFSNFTNFSEMRNKVFDLSTKECKFMIILDDSYEIHEGERLRSYLQKTKKDAIFLKIGYHKDDFFNSSYWSSRIVKTNCNFRYMYRIHECLDISKKAKSEYIDSTQFFIVDHTTKEHNTRTLTRLLNDVEMLLLDARDCPKDPRPVYYLARTYLNLLNRDEFESYLKKLLDMTNVKEYTFYAEYNLIIIEFEKTKELVVHRKKLLDLQKRYTDRAEPSYRLAVSFYEEGNLEKINHIMDRLSKCTYPNIMLTSYEYDIYEYAIPYLYVEIKFKLGRIEEGIPVLKNMLNSYPYDQKLLNMKYAVCDNLDKSSIRLSEKTLVIHTSNVPFTWTPVLGKDKNISGSEYMAMYIAKEFRDMGFRVFIFGSFEDQVLSIDYQTTIDGIQYIDNTYYSDFCLTYIIDYLIVSRNIDNLLYYNNIKNVYLWVHDVLPLGKLTFFQIHKEKFRAVICVSEWQKENLLQNSRVDKESIYVSRNAIHPKRFLNHSIERIPFRFMFSTDPTRGLQKFLDMVPLIKSRYPQSTFHVITRIKMVTEEMMKIINENNIFLCDRVTQEKLVIELLKTDVWLYPSIFDETYCISVVEAMASGCLVATANNGALSEIVGDRGVCCKNDELFEKLCEVLDNPDKKEKIIEKSYEWALKQDFHSLALEWKKYLF